MAGRWRRGERGVAPYEPFVMGNITRKQLPPPVRGRQAAVPPGDLAHQRQAEANAAITLSGARQAVKGFKDALALVRRNAGAAIEDIEFQPAAARAQFDLDRSAVAVAPSVFKQVADQPPQQSWISRQGNPSTARHAKVRANARAFLRCKANQID